MKIKRSCIMLNYEKLTSEDSILQAIHTTYGQFGHFIGEYERVKAHTDDIFRKPKEKWASERRATLQLVVMYGVELFGLLCYLAIFNGKWCWIKEFTNWGVKNEDKEW